MRTVSFQGAQLTPGQRRNMEQQQRVRASFVNPVLQQMLDSTLRNVQERKEQGARKENPWTLDYTATGTPFLGDAFGF